MKKSTPQVDHTLRVYEGKSKDITLASGLVLTIREKNGDDDDILSDSSSKDIPHRVMIDNLNKFVSSIVIKNHATGNPYITLDEVKALKATDKLQVLLESRIHSDGPELKFLHKCSNEDCKSHDNKLEYDCIEDLAKYLPSSEEPFEFKIQKHPHGQKPGMELTLSSGKKVRFQFLTAGSEYKGLEMAEDSSIRRGKNLDLLLRDLEVFDGSSWNLVGSFAIFSSSEMREIRNAVKTNDPQWPMVSEFKCPSCKNTEYIPLILIPDFYFPSEVE